MVSYYNEIDPYAAQWLRNLIDSKLIAEGDVDDRSIRDVAPGDLKGYTQCHFFAGIGVWSHALRLAGWSDDRPVWTGSCPCQPFSAAGKGAGFADERHLWPEFYRLISECRPPVVFGEQVASKDGLGWLDTVQSDMEASGYALGAADLCAAGVGAPHIRQRLWFVGERLDDTAGARHDGTLTGAEGEARNEARLRLSGEGRGPSGLADTQGQRYVQREVGHEGRTERAAGSSRKDEGLRQSGPSGASGNGGLADTTGGGQPGPGGSGGAQGQRIAEQGLQGGLVGLEHASSIGRERGQASAPGHDDDGPAPGGQEGEHGAGLAGSHRLHQDGARPTDGHWRAADWLFCRDGKWRPVEARPQPLADGSAESLGRVCAKAGAEIEEALNAAAMESEVARSALLRALRETLGAQARSVWAAGRLPGLHEAPFLLAYLRQLQIEGWCVEEGSALSREEAEARLMRVLRDYEAVAGPSHRRELEEQRARKSADVVHLLSSLLARHAQASWAHAYETYAEIGFPIGHGSPARVGRLRAYGNAIVPQAAAEVIGAYLDARP